jgi:hypothetical protein
MTYIEAISYVRSNTVLLPYGEAGAVCVTAPRRF